MYSPKRIKNYQYTGEHKNKLINFCAKCNDLGYKNNESLEAMRLEWCLGQGGQFFLTYYDDALISVSGCHPIPQVDNTAYRLLFRGVELPEYQNFFNVVSKTHMSALPFFYHVPLQIAWAKKQEFSKFVITTNWDNPDGIKSMNKSHRVFKLLARQGLVDCEIEKIHLWHTDQSVWKLNINSYEILRSEFEFRHGN